MSHPCSRWGSQSNLAHFVFLAVRDALNHRTHPDSKRQDRRKRRDLERYGSRILKRSGVVSCHELLSTRRYERKKQALFALQADTDRKMTAQVIAARLLGKNIGSTLAMGKEMHGH